MNHVMLDLETMGTVPGCAILSIGAVEFFPERGELGKEFYTGVSLYDCLENFLSKDANTEQWWEQQSAEARLVLDAAKQPDAPTLKEALSALNNYLCSLGPSRDIRLYGNGADFDNPILRVAYACASIKPYAHRYGGRCYRTLKNLGELLGEDFMFEPLTRIGTHHNALDDAKSQALHLMENLNRLKG